MTDYRPLILNDDIDFSAYLAEAEPKSKIHKLDAWRHELIERIESGEQVLGAKLPWAKTHDYIRFRGGEVSLWQGINGHGKSQLLGQACLSFAQQNEPVCIASFEMKPVATIYRMLRQFAMNDRPSETAANKMIEWADQKFWLYDQLGTVNPAVLYGVIRYCANELGVKHFVVDSLMKCVRGEDDYNGQKNFVDTLTSIARDFDMHIHLVHHVRKGENEERLPGKFDAKGSGAISDQVDQVFTVWRNKKKERTVAALVAQRMEIDEETADKPDAIVACDKNRHGGWEGLVNLWYHFPSLQYTADKRRIPVNFWGD